MLHIIWKWWQVSVCGRHVCEEFTQWEVRTATLNRPVTMDDGMLWIINQPEVEEHFRWQERQCTVCGKIQQEELEW